MKQKLNPITVVIKGGDNVERDLVGDVFFQGLVRGGFEKIHCVDGAGNDSNPERDETTLYDMIDRLRPNLFRTPITIQIDEPFPQQPIVVDEYGVERYKRNTLVEHLLDHGGIDMNKLAAMEFPVEDRQQFAQLIGYSTDGFDTLSYSPASIAARHAEEAHDQVERIKSGGAAPFSHVEVVAREGDEPLSESDLKVETVDETYEGEAVPLR